MYSKIEKIVLWLSSFEFMSYKRARYILDEYDDLEDLFDNLHSYKKQLLKVFELDELNQMLKERNLLQVDQLLENYTKLDIKIITIKSENYPELLSEIDSSPLILYCKGNISILDSECLGVVGTRRATKYGKDVCDKFVKDIASENITIVSGLADGIDTSAHRACLDVNGKTIAVLAGGVNNIYPHNNIPLADEIIEKGGLLISEYKPNEQAITYHFPVRNRIIAALSKGVFIVEATEKSGSMHTKNYALEYNREVFALPARVNDIYSSGCNKCLQCGQARMVLKASDIIEFFGKFKKSESEIKTLQLTCDEQLIYDLLLGQEKHFDELIKETKMEAKVLQTWLMRMILQGIVQKLPGNYYELIKGEL